MKNAKFLAVRFAEEAQRARDIADAAEQARALSAPGSVPWKVLHPRRLEYIHELSYLRVFTAWEQFLEESFLRYMCGYACGPAVVPVVVGGLYYRSLPAAETALLAGKDYLLWQNPFTVVKRSKSRFAAGPHEAVILSAIADIEAAAAIRHRIAHRHDDARLKFDAASLHFSGHRYRGGSAGMFLRDTNPATTPPSRWLSWLSDMLVGLAHQITA